jgi:hypothetical protein
MREFNSATNLGQMSAISSSTVRFYPHSEPKKISTQDSCNICLTNLQPYSQESSKTKHFWNHQTILVHKSEGTPKGYSCLMHGDCLKKWLRIKPICPACNSSVEFISDFTLKEKVEIISLDALDGALKGIEANALIASGIFLFVIGGGIYLGDYEHIPSALYQIVTYSLVQRTSLGIIASFSAANAGLSYLKRNGLWYFIPWPYDYDRSLIRVITRD